MHIVSLLAVSAAGPARTVQILRPQEPHWPHLIFRHASAHWLAVAHLDQVDADLAALGPAGAAAVIGEERAAAKNNIFQGC